MRFSWILCLLALQPLSLLAQKDKDKDIPAWGKVEKADLEMKTCSFDKDAEAMVLFDVAEMEGDISGRLEFTRHVRIKILKEKGFESANIHLPYISFKNIESIKKLTAQTYNLDASGNIVTAVLDKKSIMEKKLNKRVTEQVFALPEVKVGSVIEYKYTMSTLSLKTWYFQHPIPVVYSRYRMDFPYQIEVYADLKCALPYKAETLPVKGDRIVKIYSMSNVPALRDEPFISCDDDYLQRMESRLIALTTPDGVRHNLTRSWPGIIKELMEDEDFGVQLKRNIPRTADLDQELSKVSSPYEKMKVIHHYVQKNMEWNGYTSIWALDGVRAAWKDKKGTTGEINLILVNLLKDAGLDAHPVLVSTRDNGMINTLIPGFDQFDKVMAYVNLEDHVYVLDASDKNTPTHLIPEEVMLSQGLVIEKLDTYQWGWKGLFNENTLQKNMIVLQGKISPEGEMKGEAYISSIDYERLHRLPQYKKSKEDFIKAYYTDRNRDITVEDFTAENQDSDSLPFIQKFKFTQSIAGSGDYKYFTANMFSGLEKNPFVADARFSDVFFGVNQAYTIIGNFTIPEGYTFEELPKNIRMVMPDTSISMTRIANASGNVVMVRINLEFKKAFYSTEEYADFREFYKKLFEMLNEQFVFRKKASPKP